MCKIHKRRLPPLRQRWPSQPKPVTTSPCRLKGLVHIVQKTGIRMVLKGGINLIDAINRSKEYQ